MRNDLTFIAVVLDRSGSMGGVRADTIGGFNAFLDEQRKAPGQALMTLVQFDDRYEVNYSAKPLSDVPYLSELTYVPRGGTALLDAIGLTIDSVGAQLRSMPEEDRPGKVLIMIQTDGGENQSREYSRKRIADMIKHQREKYSWDFAFIGADETSIAEAVQLNIPVNFTTKYAATPEGTANVLRTASAAVANYRSVDRDVYATMDASFFDPQPIVDTSGTPEGTP
jgi:uncharacterized protein YegL